MGQPHKHAELIKVFVDGIDTQMRYEEPHREWEEVTTLHDFGYVNYEYRIKPKEKQKVKMWQWVIEEVLSPPELTYYYYKDEEGLSKIYPDARIIQRADWTEIEVEVDDEQNH